MVDFLEFPKIARLSRGVITSRWTDSRPGADTGGVTQGVIRFPRHHLAHCEDDECRCGICKGGLALCTTCGGAEGSLPTDCPGERMHELVEDEVYAGDLDYRRRQGWVSLSSNQWKSWS